MSVVTIGLDLAKTVFQVHGVDENGHAVLRKRLSRVDLLAISSINAILSSLIVFFSSFEFASEPYQKIDGGHPARETFLHQIASLADGPRLKGGGSPH